MWEDDAHGASIEDALDEAVAALVGDADEGSDVEAKGGNAERGGEGEGEDGVFEVDPEGGVARGGGDLNDEGGGGDADAECDAEGGGGGGCVEGVGEAGRGGGHGGGKDDGCLRVLRSSRKTATMENQDNTIMFCMLFLVHLARHHDRDHHKLIRQVGEKMQLRIGDYRSAAYSTLCDHS